MQIITDEDGNKWIIDDSSLDPNGEPLVIPADIEEEVE